MPDSTSRVRYDLSVLGRAGLQEWSGFVFEEWLLELQGARGMRVYREMRDTSPLIGAIIFAVEMLIRRVRWTVEPANSSTKAKQTAEFQRQALFQDMEQTWEDTLSELLSFLWFGWSYMEIVYKQRGGPSRNPTQRSKFDDNRIGWRSFALRGQESLLRWNFDLESGELLGLVQIPPPDYRERYIPLADPNDSMVRKALLFRTTTRKGNPEARSLLRNAYEPYYFAKHLRRIEAIGIERDLAGYPMAFVPPEVLSSEATPENAAMRLALEEMVRNIRRDEQEGALFPMVRDEQGNLLYDFKLLSTGGARQFDTNQVIGRYELQILQSVLADAIQIGHEANGSRAVATSKTDFFILAITAWLDSIASVITNHAFPSLLHLNAIPQELSGHLEHGEIESVDLAELGAYVLQLAQAGFPLSLDPKIQEYLAEQAHLPWTKLLKTLTPMPGTAPPDSAQTTQTPHPEDATSPEQPVTMPKQPEAA